VISLTNLILEFDNDKYWSRVISYTLTMTPDGLSSSNDFIYNFDVWFECGSGRNS